MRRVRRRTAFTSVAERRSQEKPSPPPTAPPWKFDGGGRGTSRRPLPRIQGLNRDHGGRRGRHHGGAPGGVQGNPEPLEFSKAPFVEVTAPRKIRSVRFSLMSPQEIGKCGVFHVFERNLYQMPQRVPLPNGILDTRMGTTDKKGAECATCKGKLIDCAGHFGYIKLEMPVFHIGYFKNIIAILQQVCKTCSRVMLSPEEKTQYLKRFRNPRLEIVPRRALSKKLSEKCKRCRACYYCGAANDCG